MKNSFTLLLFFMAHGLFAQVNPTCDGFRYRTEVFQNVEVTTNLEFGAGTTIGGNFQQLFMDIYEPADDQATARPAIVLAFGGSYIGGEREDLDWLCEAFAKKGFVAITIDYRLYDLPLFPLPTEEEMQEVVIKSISDMKAAIRFLREDADTDNQFRVDSELIFVGGVSAGAITAAHTAMLDSTDTISDELWAIIDDNGGLEGNSSSNLEYSSEVKGLVNYSGGLNDGSWIDSEDPTFMSYHDEFDATVPYGAGYANVLGFDIIYMEGSQVLTQVANNLGVANELHTIENSDGHVSYFFGNNESTTEVLDTTGLFLHDIICEGFVSVDPAPGERLASIEVYPNPTDGFLFVKNDEALLLGFTLYNSIGQKIGYWQDKNELDLSTLTNGTYFLQIADLRTNTSQTIPVVLGL